jgi:hypothetical protein
MTEEETIGLHGIGGKEKAADGGSGEEVGAFQNGWSGVATFGWAIADQEAGDVAFDEALVEVSEEVGEAHFGPTARAFEYADEGVEYDKTGINALDGFVEAGEVCGEREGAGVGGVG